MYAYHISSASQACNPFITREIQVLLASGRHPKMHQVRAACFTTAWVQPRLNRCKMIWAAWIHALRLLSKLSDFWTGARVLKVDGPWNRRPTLKFWTIANTIPGVAFIVIVILQYVPTNPTVCSYGSPYIVRPYPEVSAFALSHINRRPNVGVSNCNRVLGFLIIIIV